MKTDNNPPSKLIWYPATAWMGNHLGYVKGSAAFLPASTDKTSERKN